MKEIDKFYMQEQLDLAAPIAIGVDEISIGPGHSYRIVVSDLIRKRALVRRHRSRDGSLLRFDPTPIRAGIQLVILDMWKALRNSAVRNAPQAKIVYDKFHVIRHLNDALDAIRKNECRRLKGSVATSSRARSTSC